MSYPSILPGTSTPLERALEQAAAFLLDIPAPLRTLWSPDDCPPELLPWLAWALSLDNWSSDWSDEIKRARVRMAIPIARRKGTAESVRAVVESFGGGVAIREWWEQNPPAEPYTFSLVLNLGQAGAPASAAFVDQVIEEVRRTKPARSHFTFTQGLTASGSTRLIGVVRPSIFLRLACSAPADLGLYPLFQNSANGAWFDPSDLSTLFQDAAGTIPVTQPGQLVGLMRDKSGHGNHATQTTAAAKPIFGIVPATGLHNYLTHTEDLTATAWAKVAASPSTDGFTTLTFAEPSTDRRYAAYQSIPTAYLSTGAGDVKYLRGRFKPAPGITRIALGFRSSSAVFGWASYDVTTSTWESRHVSTIGQHEGISAVQISPGIWDLVVKYTSSAVAASHVLVNFGTGTADDLWKVSPAGSCDIGFLQLYKENAPYQRVTTKYDVTEAGVASNGYIEGDGIDDVMTFAGLPIGFGYYAAMGARVDALNGGTSSLGILSTAAVSTSNGIVRRASGGSVRRLGSAVRVGGGSAFAVNSVGGDQAFDVAVPFLTDGWHTGTELGVWASKTNPQEASIPADTGGVTGVAGSSSVRLSDGGPNLFYGGVYVCRPPTADERASTRAWLAAKTGVIL